MTYSELPRNSEVLSNAESPVRVYPMGFTPEVKSRLLDSLEARRLRDSERASQIGRVLNSLTTALKSEQTDLSGFFEEVRGLHEAIQDGEKVFDEEAEFITHALRTDEELAVIFAKVSRNPGGFEEIARSVTEEGASNFHDRWVVSAEGYGHASVAEHAIIHMAVENVPSLDGDWWTDHRLASFTEFSARFKGRQGVGYFTPEAVARDPQLSDRWHEVHQKLFALSDSLMAKGWQYINTPGAKAKHPERRLREKTVADQLKDLMPASRLTSIGVTMNAREVENAIRKMMSSPHKSIQELGATFRGQSLRVAPTLVKYAEANEYMVAARRGIRSIVEGEEGRDLHGEVRRVTEYNDPSLVDLISWDPLSDAKFIAAALYQDPHTGSFRELVTRLASMTQGQKVSYVESLLGGLGRWDAPIRALEMAGDYVAEFPGMTYGMWREFKRHRMQSYFVKDLDVRWGYMMPPLVVEMDESENPEFHGGQEAIKQMMGDVEDLFNRVYKVDPYAAQYVVTRLHYRPAVAKFNTREAYHLLELRTGPTAHPFIRRLMWPLFDQIKQAQPILMEHLRLRLNREGRPNRDFVWTY